jgi:hypothetical protein
VIKVIPGTLERIVAEKLESRKMRKARQVDPDEVVREDYIPVLHIFVPKKVLMLALTRAPSVGVIDVPGTDGLKYRRQKR